MKKVIAYTALHYGAAYLGWAIRSVIDHVDEYHVLYSAKGSHGHRTKYACPDKRGQLYEIAQQAAGRKLRWHDGDWTAEGQQRDTIHQLEPDADAIVVLDADEVWASGLVEMCLAQHSAGFRNLYVPIFHLWRSFQRAIIHDPAYPVRVIFQKYPDANYGGINTNGKRIAHFGYAQNEDVTYYKIQIHGHLMEFRDDINWYDDRFMANAQTDCHPIGSEYWNTEEIEPLDYMPDFMVEHPYYDLKVIK